MIFVTVGTHEQQFNRLVEYMDKWATEHDEEVIIQSGYSTYEPKYANWSRLFPYNCMLDLVKNARIVITHGGPSSFIMPLQVGKTPIVVPRKYSFGEHVNNHQVEFTRSVADRMGTIIAVEDVDGVGETIERYDEIVASMRREMSSNNAQFCEKLEEVVYEMF